MDLIHVLETQDSGFWRIIARAWDVAQITDAPENLPALVQAMLDPERVRAMYQRLPSKDQAAIDRIRGLGGKMPLARFSGEFGELREMGVARREREQPWINPISSAERLWYQGWLGRTFWDSPGGPEEFVFIPDDLLRLVPFPATQTRSGLAIETYLPRRGEQASQAGLRSAWDTCTLLAFLRNYPPRAGEEPPQWMHRHVLERHLQIPENTDLLLTLLVGEGWVAGDPLRPEPASARAFLELEPQSALQRLIRAWRGSPHWNDLAHVPGIALGAKEWPNDPLRTRLNFLEILRDLPQGEWILVDSLVRTVEEQRPDFQRPLTALSSWYLLDQSTGEPLPGSDRWTRVEGALIRFYLRGPLHWLGITDLLPSDSSRAFRLTPLSQALWGEETPGIPLGPSGKGPGRTPSPRFRAEGTVIFPADGSALRRYQLSRCTSWVARRGKDYVYRITPRALQRARAQGIEVSHVIALLNTLGESQVPPSLVRAITRWGQSGAEASIRSLRVLDLSRLMLEAPLWDLPAVKACLGEALGPRTWAVPRDRVLELRAALMKHGVLVELEDEE
jgi:hypothetical protein